LETFWEERKDIKHATTAAELIDVNGFPGLSMRKSPTRDAIYIFFTSNHIGAAELYFG
jgi:hypothetical protein